MSKNVHNSVKNAWNWDLIAPLDSAEAGRVADVPARPDRFIVSGVWTESVQSSHMKMVGDDMRPVQVQWAIAGSSSEREHAYYEETTR